MQAARAVQVRAESTSRPLWFPGNPAPKHLTGKLAGDYGFDPLNLGDDEQNLKWCGGAAGNAPGDSLY